MPLNEQPASMATLRDLIWFFADDRNAGTPEWAENTAKWNAALDELEVLREQVRQARAELDKAVSVNLRQHLTQSTR